MLGKKTQPLVDFSYVCENKYWVLSLEKPQKNINRMVTFSQQQKSTWQKFKMSNGRQENVTGKK